MNSFTIWIRGTVFAATCLWPFFLEGQSSSDGSTHPGGRDTLFPLLPPISPILPPISPIPDPSFDSTHTSDRGPLYIKDAIIVTRAATENKSAQLGLAADVRSIQIELKTDNAIYHAGDEPVVTVKTSEPGHLRLLYQNAAGEIYTLFPNQFITDDAIEGRREVRIMPRPNPQRPEGTVAIQIAGPQFGKEFLAAIISTEPFADEAALREQFLRSIFAKSTASSFERAIRAHARILFRQDKDGAEHSAAVGVGFARVTLKTAKK